MRWTMALPLLLALAATAAADIVLLVDGRIIEDRPMTRAEGGIEVVFENGKVLIPDRLIQDAVLANDPALQPTTDEEREKAEKGLVRFEGRWITPSRRDQVIAKRVTERKASIKEIRAHAQWRDRYKSESKHFKFEYVVPPHIYEYYRDMMEAYFKEFGKTWGVKPLKEQPKLPIMFYTDRTLFGQVGGAGGGALAYFRFVMPREINFYYDRLDPVQTEKVMYHEVNHYLQLLLDEKFNMPHFPGEALAEYYGGSKYDPRTRKLTVGLVQEGRLVEVKDDIVRDELLSLEKMVKTDMYADYYWGWSLVHYCMQDRKLKKGFEKYVRALVSGRGVKRVGAIAGMVTVQGEESWRVFRASMGLKNPDAVKKFEAAWHQYCKDLKIETAGGLEKAAFDASRSGRSIRARRLYKEAIDKGSTSGLTYHRYAELLSQKGKRDEAIPMWRKAIELDPLEAEFYVSLGRALARSGQKDEGKRLLALAKELDPDNPWLNTELPD